MFQYAAGRALACNLHTDVVVDDALLREKRYRVTPRRLELFGFPVAARLASAVEKGNIRRQTSPTRRLLAKFGGGGSPSRVFRDVGYSFQPALLQRPDMTILDGYWQSEKYFKAIESVIAEEFDVQMLEDSRAAEIRDRIRATTSVGVHIRRGDYIANPRASAFHGELEFDYYRRALELVDAKIGRARRFVFSDDPLWVADHFDITGEFINVSAIRLNAIEELVLMKACHHQVIANSSFSWWGAWLNPQRNKIVVAPAKWFRGAQQPTDLLPAGWCSV